MRSVALCFARRSTITSLLFAISLFVNRFAAARCECGFSLPSSADDEPSQVFTDLLESDFLHIRNIDLNTDWQRQNFTKTPEAGRGPYGMNFTISNVFSNPIPNHANWTGPGERGGDPGVQLMVDGGIPSDGYVDIGQMDSFRHDMLWGSYRAAMKLSPVAGTCAAFFWYFNDSQEIDMEFLSKDFDYEQKIFPVNLVLQTPRSASAGFSVQGANNYIVTNLTFDPTSAFHEYRMDLVPGGVIFYADGQRLAKMTTTFAPSEPGHMILTHWSNGNNGWTGGPPLSDASLSVSYVKAYFNSSDPERKRLAQSRCRDPSLPEAVCKIPDQNFAPDLRSQNPFDKNKSAAEVLFYIDQPETRKGQIFYDKNVAGRFSTSHTIVYASSLSFLLAMVL